MSHSDSVPRVTFFASGCSSLLCIQVLQQKGMLAGVVIAPVVNNDTFQLKQTLEQSRVNIAQYDPENQLATLIEMQNWHSDMGITFAFNEVLPKAFLQFFSGNLFNIHPAKLNEYQGPMPLYWQIRNGVVESKLVLHKVLENTSPGPVALEEPYQIHPMDNLQSLSETVMLAASELLKSFFNKYEAGTIDWCEAPKQQGNLVARQLTSEDAWVNWQAMTSKQIVDAARAGNPHFGGLLLPLGAGELQLMVASEKSHKEEAINPGTILQIDNESGLLVSTKDGVISLDVIVTPNGYYSGYQFAIRYGLAVGMRMVKTVDK